MKKAFTQLVLSIIFLILYTSTGSAQQTNTTRQSELDAVIKELETNGYEAVKNKKLTLRAIHYVSGTSQLSSEDKQYLDTVAIFLTRVPTVIMELSGHTDNIGNKNANNRLSQDRARSAMEYVVSRGVLAQRIRAIGYGSSQPVSDNRTEVGRALNRRVELRFLGLTNDVYTLVTKSGRKIPATYVVMSADGRAVSYRENANSPLVRVPSSGIDYIEYPDGSRRRPDVVVLSGGDVLNKQIPSVTPEEHVAVERNPFQTQKTEGGIGKWLGGKFPKISRWSVMANGGIAPLSIDQHKIIFAYVDESPSRDNLQSTIDLDKRQFAGAGQIGFELETNTHWLVRLQYQFGKTSQAGFKGVIMGVGKSFGRKGRFITSLDLTLGSAYLKLGELVQNDLYIQVNSSTFYSKTVQIQFRNYYAAFTPQIAYSFPLGENMALRLTGGYSYSFHTKSMLRFDGKNGDGKAVNDSEKLSADNVNFNLDGTRATSADLFKLRGPYVTVGILYHLYHRSE